MRASERWLLTHHPAEKVKASKMTSTRVLPRVVISCPLRRKVGSRRRG